MGQLGCRTAGELARVTLVRRPPAETLDVSGRIPAGDMWEQIGSEPDAA